MFALREDIQMDKNNVIIAKDKLGNIWKFGNLSCTSGLGNLSYSNLQYITCSGIELTLSANGENRIFYFDTPTDAAHLSEIIKSVSQNPEKYNKVENLISNDDYLRNADIRDLLVESVKYQRHINHNLKKTTTILYIWITIVLITFTISAFLFLNSLNEIT